MTEPDLKSPFPLPGGKNRAASLMWERIGNPPNVVIPFAGSLAELWARPDEPRIETVNDLDCHIACVWRALKKAPEETAYWADDPVNEADMHARHRWIVLGELPENRRTKAQRTIREAGYAVLAEQNPENLEQLREALSAALDAELAPPRPTGEAFRQKMRTDPEYFDAQIAGWWIWGQSAWIGSGWCRVENEPREQLPQKMPVLGGTKGSGVHRKSYGKLPHLSAGGNGGGPTGIHSAGRRGAILETFCALAERLRNVRVACGDFERVCSDAITWRHGLTAVILDPEYLGCASMYGAPSPKGDQHVFHRAARYAVEAGKREDMRVVLCGYAGTFDPPAGWTTVAWKAQGGYGGQRKDGSNKNAERERIWFSPACLKPNETSAGQLRLGF